MLNLLQKFQAILLREILRADLESKFMVILYNYGLELPQVQDQFEKLKAAPPLVRNLPQVAWNITWFQVTEPTLDKFEGKLKQL